VSRRRGLLAAALLVLLATPSAHAAAPAWKRYRVADPAATLARVNALRTSFGAPPLAEVPAWSVGCAKHMAYLNVHAFGHDEVPGARGYTRAGALAGQSSVLAFPPAEPFGRGNPLGLWAGAPYHQAQVLDPRLRETGFALGCMDVLRGIRAGAAMPDPAVAAPAPRLLAWPGMGARGVPRAIDACSELPSNPFADVGWSCGGVGSAFYVYALDPVTGGCASLAQPPTVAVTAGVRAIPTKLAAGGPCGWIVLTGRALPRDALVQMTVAAGGATLVTRFSTRPRARRG